MDKKFITGQFLVRQKQLKEKDILYVNVYAVLKDLFVIINYSNDKTYEKYKYK